MDTLHRRLERSRQMQTVLRAFEARDRNLLEDNLWRVSFWSCAGVLVMLCVALTQVTEALLEKGWDRLRIILAARFARAYRYAAVRN